MVNIQKSISFLYMGIEQLEFEIKNTIPLILASEGNIFMYTCKKCTQSL